ncbi:tetratricopeptide repeat protein [Hymenobacter sp. NST-14]|uniref:tetratricopeptide repeat protein n=1 Tax=Hymenobacter piscis TaxID=2839984 RepID=UPI001C0276C4|nr:tetratricopeptide repeat protein [Hymenobacter piscis]MBT9392865.1 tetratricopeptide repeat protein [Hymenobacter piscis]
MLWLLATSNPAAATAPADSARVNRLNAEAFELRGSNPRLSRQRFEQAAALATRGRYARGQAQAWLGLGFYHRKRNEYGPALAFTRRAEPIFQRLRDVPNQIAVVYNLGYVYFGQGNYARALASGQTGLLKAEVLQDAKWLVLMSAQLGFISTQLGEYEQARRYLERSQRLARQAGDQGGVSQSLRGLGDLYRAQGNWAAARRYYEQDAALARRLGDRPGQLVEELNIADMSERQGRYAEALRYGRQVRARLRRLDVVGYLPWVELVLARAQLHTGRADSALYYGRPSLTASQRSGVKENIRDVSQVLAEASARQGRFADAYRYHRLFAAYRDTLSSRDLIRRTAALQYSYELARRQARIGELTRRAALSRQQVAQQRRLLGVSLVGLLLVTALSVVLWRSNHQKNRAYGLLARQQAQLVATQQQLVAAEKWAFVGEVSAGIAHELQNPLHFMNRLAAVSNTLLAQEPAGAVADELGQEILGGLRQNLHEISQHGQRASSIISSMLTHARVGATPLAPTPLNQVVAAQLALAYEARPAPLALLPPDALQTELDPAVGLVPLAADMERVLLNLFTNALHALTTRGQQAPAAYAPVLRVSTHRTGRRVQVRIHDNGTGMAAAVRARVFEPFFTTKAMGEGTGLGLSLAHDIVTKGHGGTLTVTSREGHYTEFLLTLNG